MEYRAVHNRIAVHMKNLGYTKEHVLTILSQFGVVPVEEDVCRHALSCVGMSQFMRGAHPKDAPKVVDCSGLIKWIFGKRGIWLPRRSIQQFTLAGNQHIPLADLRKGDVVYKKGKINYHDDAGNEVGHVGIMVDDHTIVTAKNKDYGVIALPLTEFVTNNTFTGGRRFIPHDEEVLTFNIPADTPLTIETEEDILWIIRQNSIPNTSNA